MSHFVETTLIHVRAPISGKGRVSLESPTNQANFLVARNMDRKGDVPTATPRRSLTREAGGAIVVEYTMILVFVALPLVAGLTAGGVMMLREYRLARDLILLPVP